MSTYKNTRCTKCKSLEDISTTTNSSINEHRYLATHSLHNLQYIILKFEGFKSFIPEILIGFQGQTWIL